MIISENDIEKAVIDLVKQSDELNGYTTINTLHALNPAVYDFNSASGGAILVSCNGTDYTRIKQFRSNAGAEFRVTVSMGITGIRTNEKLWDKKAALYQALAYKKLLPEVGKMQPINDSPLYPEAVDGVFWIKMEFSIINYMGI